MRGGRTDTANIPARWQRIVWLLALAAPAWGQVSISSIQSSLVTANSPNNVQGITSGVQLPGNGFTMWINGSFPNPAAGTTVQWFNPATGVTFTGNPSTITTTQLRLFIPENLYLTPVASTQTVQITVTQGPSATGQFFVNPTVTSPASPLPIATVGVTYSSPIVLGGTPPYVLGAVSGVVPPGLNPGTGAQNQFLTGIPTTQGVFTFGPAVTDQWGVGLQKPLQVQVVAAATVSLIAPNQTAAGSGLMQMNVTGTNFVDPATPYGGSVVQWKFNGVTTSLATTFNSSTSLTATIPTALMSTPGVASVFVLQPDSTVSGALPFTLLAPVIGSLNPSSIMAGSAAFTLTVNGSNFSDRTGAPDAVGIKVAQVQFGATLIQATFINSSTLQVTIPANLITTSGMVPVTEINPGGATSNTVNFNVYPVLVINTSTLPTGTSGASYSATVAASGGSGAYTWTATGLPANLTINALSGNISGIPQAPGSFPISVKVTDGQGNNVTAPFTLTINAPPLVITTSSLPTGTSGTSYSTTVQASGGFGTYTWTATGLPANLTINAQSGTISGIPQAPGSFPVSVKVTDGQNTSTTAPFTLTINPAPLTIATQSLPPGTAGSPYTTTVVATGGVGAYTWSATGLPANLAIDAPTGNISGTPQTPGSFPISVKVTDGTTSVSAPFTLTINPAQLVITTSTLPAGTSGTVYNATVQASGGFGTYTWSATGLPANLTINAQTGNISGTPQAPGSFPISVKVTDAQNSNAAALLTLIINAPPLVITTPGLPAGTSGTAYNATVMATGGFGTYTWTATGLPANLGINAQTGNIGGTPQAPGSFTISVKVTDAQNTSTTALLTLRISAPPLVIATQGLPVGSAGTAYNATVTATGGFGGYTWAANGLPANLAINAQTGNISGTPQSAGSFPVSVKVTDGQDTSVTVPFTLTINRTPPLTITTVSLSGGTSGTLYSSNVTATGGLGGYTWSATGLPTGLGINPQTGVITGIPQTGGNFLPSVTVTDGQGTSVTAAFTITINLPPPAISTPPTLPGGTVGVSYQASIGVSGGGGPFTYTVSSGSLPDGLSLTLNGLIYGTPSKAGTFSFSITAADPAGNAPSKGFTITIAPAPLTVPGGGNTTGPVGTPLTIDLTPATGTPPYRYSVNCDLPQGLTFTNGVISGTPTTAGKYDCRIVISDSTGSTVTKDITITVSAAGIAFRGGTLPDGQVGVSYTASVSATGGTAPFTYTGTGLPAGLTLAAGGAISGTPTTDGATTFTVTAIDAAGAKATASFTITVAPAKLLVTTASLPDGMVGANYSASLAASGGVKPYTWTVTGLPGGLTVTVAGVISGTPTAAGKFSVTATAKDNAGVSVSASYTVTIAPPPVVITTTPTAGGTVGAAYSASFTATGGVTPITWSATGLPGGLTISTAGVISGTPTAPGTYAVTVTAKDAAGATASKAFTIVVALPATPPLNFAGITATSNALQQPRLTVALATAYPADVIVNLTLTFTPDTGADDPNVVFANGKRTASITVPQGSLAGATDIGVQIGSVSGVIAIVAQLQAAGLDVTPSPAPRSTIRINPAAPVMTTVTATRTATGFNVTINGYVTDREITQAIFTFNAAPGSNLQTTSLTVTIDTLFSAYYGAAASAPYGSQFTFTQPFTVNGNSQAIASVTVTLVNKVGNSTVVTANLN